MAKILELGPNRMDSDGWSALKLFLVSDTCLVRDKDGELVSLKLDEQLLFNGVTTLLLAGADVRLDPSVIEFADGKGYHRIAAVLRKSLREKEGTPLPEKELVSDFSAGGGLLATVFSWAVRRFIR